MVASQRYQWPNQKDIPFKAERFLRWRAKQPKPKPKFVNPGGRGDVVNNREIHESGLTHIPPNSDSSSRSQGGPVGSKKMGPLTCPRPDALWRPRSTGTRGARESDAHQRPS